MAQFRYTALDKDGARVSGEIEGASEMDAASRVRQEYEVLLNLTEVKRKAAPSGVLSREVGSPRLNHGALTVLCGQFAILLRAGIPAGRCVRLIARKTGDSSLKRLLEQAAEDLEAGKSLSASFAAGGAAFLPATFVETIRAGEASGNLARSFETMRDYFEKQGKLRGRVRRTMSYPLLVLAMAALVVLILLVRVVPAFTALFDNYDAALPLMTRVLIAVSGFFRRYLVFIVALAAVLVILWNLYGHTRSGRLRLARMSLGLPVLGEIQELNAASQFANTLATLLNAGIPLNRGVSIAARVMDNAWLSAETEKLSGKLEEGESLGAAMAEQGVLPEILVDMAAVGEESGEMAKTLEAAGGYYDGELEAAVEKALSRLEPALLLITALVAGYIVLSVYLAMFSLYGSM